MTEKQRFKHKATGAGGRVLCVFGLLLMPVHQAFAQTVTVPQVQGSRIQFPTTGYWFIRDASEVEICQGNSQNGTSNNYGSSGSCEQLSAGTYTYESSTVARTAIAVPDQGGGTPNDGAGAQTAAEPVAQGSRIQFPTTGYWFIRDASQVEICQGNSQSGTSNIYGSSGSCEQLSTGTYTYESSTVARTDIFVPGGGGNSDGGGNNDGGGAQTATVPLAQGFRIQFPTTGYWFIRDSSQVEICQGNRQNGTSNNYGSNGSCEQLSPGTYTYESSTVGRTSFAIPGEGGGNNGSSDGGSNSTIGADSFVRADCGGCNSEYGVSQDDISRGIFARNNRREFFHNDTVTSSSLNFRENPNSNNPPDPLLTRTDDPSDIASGADGNGGNDGTGTGNAGDGNFRVSCQWSHFSEDDSIVLPDDPGAAHLHMFFGNTSTDAFTDTTSGPDIESRGGGSCNGFALNRSAYWIPALLYDHPDDNQKAALVPEQIIIYYKDGSICENEAGSCPGNEIHTVQQVEEMPQGLQLVAGWDDVLNLNALGDARFYDTNNLLDDGLHNEGGRNPNGMKMRLDQHLFWSCGPSDGDPNNKSRFIPDCNAYATATNNPDNRILNATIYMPQCWNESLGLTKRNDGVRHVVHRAEWQECPAEYPDRLPQLAFLIYWKLDEIGNSREYLRLSSDPAWSAMNSSDELSRFVVQRDPKVDRDVSHRPGGTLHADWIAGWNENVQKTWIDKCIKDLKNCNFGETGAPYAMRILDDNGNGHYDGHDANGPKFGYAAGQYRVKVQASAFQHHMSMDDDDMDRSASGRRIIASDTRPERVTLISPIGRQSVTARSPVELSWNDDNSVTTYRTRVYDRSIPGWLPWVEHAAEDFCNGDVCVVDGPALAESRAVNVYWQVNAKNVHGWSGATLFRDGTFRVHEDEIPPTPVKVSPLGGANVDANVPVTLTWQPDVEALRYQVQRYDRISRSWSYRQFHWKEDVCSASSCSIEVPETDAHVSSFWRVRSWNRKGWGAWSNYRDARFHVVD